MLALKKTVERLIKELSFVLIWDKIADIDARITELELKQEGTEILETMLGYTIGD